MTAPARPAAPLPLEVCDPSSPTFDRVRTQEAIDQLHPDHIPHGKVPRALGATQRDTGQISWLCMCGAILPLGALPRSRGRVEWIRGADDAADAIKWLPLALAGEQSDLSGPPVACVVSLIAEDGSEDTRVFGRLCRRDAAYLAALILRYAVD